MADTITKIIAWAQDRNLIDGATSHAQMLKLIEEVGELAAAIARGNQDGIGDAVVVLAILAAQNGLRIEDCIDSAYNEIKDRKGQMVGGIFIKEAE